jgi:exopolysaccharide production protein ExoZ
MEINSEKRIFNNLQALRGIAALLVCAFHYRYIINETWSEVLFANGWIGVQIFFIISGFIMVHTTSRIKSNFQAGAKKFLVSRIIRIVPLYYICTFLFIVDDLNDGYLIENGSRLLHSLLFIYPEKTLKINPSLEVGWSLNYEMMFYFLFTVAILFGLNKLRFLYIWFFIVIFLIPLLLLGEISSNYKSYMEYPWGYINFISNPILMHFLLGVILAQIIPKLKISKSVANSMMILSFVLLFVYITDTTGIPINNWFDLLAGGFVVFSVLINDFHEKGLKLPSIFVKLGDMSYSFYLVHPIVIGYIPLLFLKLSFLKQLKGTPLFVFTLLLTLICSWIFYKTVEVTLTNYLRNKFIPSTQKK